MSDISVVVASPKFTLKAVLENQPVASAPVQLRAFLFDGENDISSEASFTWHVSWGGSYSTYSMQVGNSSSLTIRLTVGGDRLLVAATHKKIRYRKYIRMGVKGTNPTYKQVDSALGDNNVLKAMLWQESTWRQFNKSGKPLKNKGSSARGVGQIMEYFWADSDKISHHDYLRIAWQWDYNLKAVLEIFKYYQSLVRKAHPGVTLEKLTDWTIYIYHRGPEHLKDQVDPATYDYVAKTRRLMVEKPWEE